MNTRESSFSWKGFAVLVFILLIVSVVAFIISSIEGFITGVIAVFIGFLLSFFRDDIKRLVGISNDSSSEVDESRPLEPSEIKHLAQLEKYVAKGRVKLEKSISKFESKEKPKKRRKLAREIVEGATSLISLIDQIKSRAILLHRPKVAEHYSHIAEEIESIRKKYSQI
ncbi:MAG: hypothetical protein GF411_06865 [Candidatus Lokiarchaeota archaeon]|nr:hypothetical protein [Candidatus Lokiarchaeota archaeon]